MRPDIVRPGLGRGLSAGCAACHCTSVVQPPDIGIMPPCEAKLHGVCLTDPNVYSKTENNRLTCIKRAIRAWKDIYADSIRSAFRKAIPQPGSWNK